MLTDDAAASAWSTLRWLALPAILLAYPLVVLPRALWMAWRARRRLRSYGPPVVLVTHERRLRGPGAV